MRELRLENGLRQKDVAEKIGVCTASYGFYENWINKPDPETLVKLANLYNVSVDYLLGLTDDFGTRSAAPMSDTYSTEEQQVSVDTNFSLKLKELRQEKELTQIDIAKGINTSQRNISRWENGENEPTSSFVVKLAEYFNVTTDYLLGLEDDYGAKVAASIGDTYTAEERQLIEDFRQLNYYKRDLIKNNIKAMLPTEAESKKKKA